MNAKGTTAAPLGSLCEVITKGSSPNWQGFEYCEKGIPFVRSQNVGWGNLDLSDVAHLPQAFNQKERKSVLRTDDVLLNLVGASIGRACIASSEVDGGNVNQAVAVIRVRKDVLSPPYLKWFLVSPNAQARIHSEKVDVARANFSLEDTRSLPIPVVSLPEQRQIVAEIEKQFTRLEAGVAALRRVQANLKRYRAAVLKAACEGRLVPTEAELQKSVGRSQKSKAKFETGSELLARILTERRNNLKGRGKYEEPTAPNTLELPPLPDSWAWATVEQLLRNDSGLGYGILKPGKEDPNGVPMVRVMDIDEGKLSGTEIVKVEAKLSEEFNRTVLESGDILLAVMATVGRCTVVPEHLVGANVNRALAVIKPTHLVLSKFLELAIRSPRLQHLFQKNKIGSAQARINLTDLRTYCLPLPPLAEQTRIVAEVERRLSVVEELESVVTANLQRASRLRQSILQKAFTGELT